MQGFSYYILPSAAVIIIVYGLASRTKVFDAFIAGAKKGMVVFKNLFPSLLALIVAVNMLEVSGGLAVITRMLEPIARVFGFPKEVLPLAVISPLSGSGSLSVFENLLGNYGADSFIGRVASVLMGSTETTFYAVAVYYGAVGVKKTRHTVAAGLFADFVSFLLSSLTVRLFFAE